MEVLMKFAMLTSCTSLEGKGNKKNRKIHLQYIVLSSHRISYVNNISFAGWMVFFMVTKSGHSNPFSFSTL